MTNPSYSLWGSYFITRATGAAFGGPGNYFPSRTSTEPPSQTPAIAGTFSGLTILCDQPSGGTQEVLFRKNAANGNQSITPSIVANRQILSDNTDTDTVATGDLVDWNITGTTGINVYGVWGRFQGSSSYAALWQTNGFSAINDFVVPQGLVGGQTATESQAQIACTVAGTVQGSFLNIATNTVNASCTYVFRKNGANGNQSITIGSGLTGTFQDTTHTDSIAVGDLYCAKISTSGSGSLVCNTNGAWFTNTVPVADWLNQIFGDNVFNNQFTALTGEGVAGYATVYASFNFACRTSQFAIFMAQNNLNASCTIAMAKNGSAGNQSVTVGAGLTGWFTDNTNSDIFAPTDTFAGLMTSAATTGMATIGGKRFTQSQLFPTSSAGAGAASASAVGVAAKLAAGSAAGVAAASATGIAAAIGAGLIAGVSSASAIGLAVGIGGGTAAGLATAAAIGISVAVRAGFANAVSSASAVARSFALAAGSGLGMAIASATGAAIGWLRISGATAAWAMQSGQSASWAPQSGQSEIWTPQSGEEPQTRT